MPKRTDIKKILLIGSGPIVIGQACEFDYSGTQACKALREEGYEVVLVNSNPATIMTDPDMADRTYIEPLTWEIVEKVIEQGAARRAAADARRPDGPEPGDGPGQARRAGEVRRRDDRRQARRDRQGRGARRSSRRRWRRSAWKCCRGETVHTIEEARRVLEDVGLPCVVRPSFTLGGSGSAIAYNRDEFDTLVRRGLDQSPVHEVLIEEIDHRLERVRDGGDARHGRQRRHHLLDRELRPDGRAHGRLDHRRPGPDADRQRISADARRQPGRDPRDRRRDRRLEHSVRHPSADGPDDRHRDESPRQPLSSALACKATGFPIAKIAAKLAVGYRLHELPNDITREDDGLLRADDRLRRHQDSAVRLREIPRSRRHADDADEERRRDDGHRPHVQGVVPKGAARPGSRRFGFGCDGKDLWGTPEQPGDDEIRAKLAVPNAERVWYLRYAIKSGHDASRRSTS